MVKIKESLENISCAQYRAKRCERLSKIFIDIK